MTTRAQSTDPRAARVREAMKAAAFDLALHHPIGEVSVQDITAAAGVSRQVFYQHFADRDDAVAASVADSFRLAVPPGAVHDPQTALRRLEQLAAYTAEYRTLYRNLYPGVVSERAADAFRAELQPACRALARQRAAADADVRSIDTVTRFLTGGFLELLRQITDDGDDPSSDLHSLLDTVFTTPRR